MEKEHPTDPKLELLEGRGKTSNILQAGSLGEFLQRRPGDLVDQQAEGSLSLEQWETQWQEFLRTLDNPHSGCGIPHLPEKPSPWKDTTAFLASFEQVAEACWWPREHWLTRLLPALSGEAEKAFKGLDVRDREDYGKVKAAILQGEALSREMQRQQFRCFCYQEAEGPRGAYRQLWEMCRGWLRLENHSKEQILELLVLEQLLSILPPEIQGQVQRCGPQSCSQAVTMAEEFLFRQEKQVPLEDEAWSGFERGQALSESQQMQLSLGIKEEKDGEACLLAGDMEEEGRELLGLSWEKVKKEETEGSVGNQDGPGRQEGSHTGEKRDQPFPCQAEYFGGLLLQQEEPAKKQRNKCLSADGRIHSREEQSESLKFGNCMVEGGSDTSVLYQVGDVQQNPHPAQKKKNKGIYAHGRIHSVEKQNENTEVGNSYAEVRSHHMIPTEENQHECSKCGMSFSDVAKFNGHLQMHSAGKPFQCFECGKSFRQRSHLRDHQRIHTGEKPHSCSECGKSFALKSSLVRHLIIHSEDKWFKCSECGKRFSQKTKLTSHQRIHTVEEPYKCEECGMNFTNQTQFNIHLQMHHGKKPHKCSECGKSFLYRALLLRHQRMHTGEKPYNCLECGKSFSAKSYLVIHQRIHSGEKPYKCSECGKRFRTRDKLTLHHRSHTGEKPYACLECGKNFSQKKYLQRHQIIHTRGIL